MRYDNYNAAIDGSAVEIQAKLHTVWDEVFKEAVRCGYELSHSQLQMSFDIAISEFRKAKS